MILSFAFSGPKKTSKISIERQPNKFTFPFSIHTEKHRHTDTYTRKKGGTHKLI